MFTNIYEILGRRLMEIYHLCCSIVVKIIINNRMKNKNSYDMR